MSNIYNTGINDPSVLTNLLGGSGITAMSNHGHTFNNGINIPGKISNPEFIEIQIKLVLTNLIYSCGRCKYENINQSKCLKCKNILITKSDAIALNDLKCLINKNKSKIDDSIITKILQLKEFNKAKIEFISNEIIYNLLRMA